MILDEVRAVYEEYTAQVTRLESDRKAWDGLFGMGKKLADNPCHERFYEELEKLLKAFAEGKPSSEEIRRVLELIYRAPCNEEQPSSAVMPMNAVHSLTPELAEMLSAKDAEAVLEQYKKDYPRNKRFPAHKNVIKALERAQKS